jgi:hypothetical protein
MTLVSGSNRPKKMQCPKKQEDSSRDGGHLYMLKLCIIIASVSRPKNFPKVAIVRELNSLNKRWRKVYRESCRAVLRSLKHRASRKLPLTKRILEGCDASARGSAEQNSSLFTLRVRLDLVVRNKLWGVVMGNDPYSVTWISGSAGL